MSLLSGYNEHVTTILSDGGSATPGTVFLPILLAPFGGVTVKSAYLSARTAVGANGSNYFTATLHNGGTAGTATTAIGTAGGTAGVTAAPQAFSLNTSADELSAGQYLVANLVKTGTLAENEFSLIVTWVHGKG
jgi:hypothetical protein